ncbi:hypothetical protein KSP40_PGU017773 [Platanthera guangdongensis]|uniref:Secreted protein n=1 Tax=Platanthera guangdongensis TaxID=2320717 RepID=A0ABR2LQB5_9ASPA
MNARSELFVAFFLLAVIFVVSKQGAAASRQMPARTEQGRHAGNSGVTEKARMPVMTMWMTRLPSGPSHRGAGH